MSRGAYVAGAVLCAALLGWLFWRRDWIAIVFCAPLFAYFTGRAIVVWGFDCAEWLSGKPKEKWNGLYYEYGFTHLRAADQGDRLVFLEKDILHLIEQPDSRTVQLFGLEERVAFDGSGAMALTEAGCRRLLVKCPHPQAKGLLLYLEREAFWPHAKRLAHPKRELAP
jgi:hypothetical protein